MNNHLPPWSRVKYAFASSLSCLLHGSLQVEKLVPCQLSAYQKALCQLAEGEVQTEEACKEPQALKRMNNTLMELRTICNHPLIRCLLLLLMLLLQLLLQQHLP